MPLTSLLASAFLGLTAAKRTGPHLELTFSPEEIDDCLREKAPNAPAFDLNAIPTTYYCFNLNDTFSSTSPINNANYTLFNAEFYNPNTTYDQILYAHPEYTSDSSNLISTFELLVYNGRDCVQVSTANNASELEPYYRWNCYDGGGHCEEMDFGVQSFALNPNTDRSGKCAEAVKEGGTMGLRVGWMMGVVGLAVGFAMLMA